MIVGWVISCEIIHRWMPLHLTDDKSTLVQVMAWCVPTTSHYLRPYWPSSMSPFGVTKLQWVNEIIKDFGEIVNEIVTESRHNIARCNRRAHFSRDKYNNTMFQLWMCFWTSKTHMAGPERYNCTYIKYTMAVIIRRTSTQSLGLISCCILPVYNIRKYKLRQKYVV